MQHYHTENPYEKLFGYSRAVRKGNLIFVSGTTSIDPKTGTVLHPTSAELQAITAFDESLKAVEALGGQKADVVRVRMYVRNGEDTEGVGKAFKDRIASEDGGPAATMIVGVGFVDEKILVEIEVDAVTD